MRYQLKLFQCQNLNIINLTQQNIQYHCKMSAYSVIQGLSIYSSNLLFRDIDIINPQNLPKQGATIVYGNHNNQFIDGSLMMATFKRRISFIAAAVSCRRKVIGSILRGAGVIPVQRPQDTAKKGSGKIIEVICGDRNSKVKIVIGKNTRFKSEVLIGETITFNKTHRLKVKEIVSDQQISTETERCPSIQGDFDYLIVPNLDYNQLYQKVWSSLSQGACIGIFPQGGSHDQLQLLPFKAGIAIMALGAIQKHKVPVTLVPCGFNYYNPQKFRSKVVIQFGPAYQIPQELVDLYRKDKKQAISILLTNLSQMLKNVTTSMKTFSQLSTLFACRELYTMNIKRKLSTQQKLILNRRFAKGFDMLAQQQRYQKTFQQLKQINQFIKIHRLKISQNSKDSNLLVDLLRFFFYFEKCLLRVCFAIPGLIVMGPTIAIIRYFTQKQRKKQQLKARKKDLQNQFGNDIVSSYRLLLSIILFPISNAFNSIGLFFLLQKLAKMNKKNSAIFSLAFYFLLPVYGIFLVKSYDSLGRSFKKLKFLILKIFQRNKFEQFTKMKKQLARNIKKVVDQRGDDVVQNFKENRLVKQSQLNISSASNLLIKIDSNMQQLEQ